MKKDKSDRYEIPGDEERRVAGGIVGVILISIFVVVAAALILWIFKATLNIGLYLLGILLIIAAVWGIIYVSSNFIRAYRENQSAERNKPISFYEGEEKQEFTGPERTFAGTLKEAWHRNIETLRTEKNRFGQAGAKSKVGRGFWTLINIVQALALFIFGLFITLIFSIVCFIIFIVKAAKKDN